MRAFEVAGRPQQTTPLGSFEDWSLRIRDCLIWLGRADPCETMEQIRATDPNQEEIIGVIEHWALIIKDHPMTVREVVETANRQKDGGGFMFPDFHEALMSVAGVGAAINTKRTR